DMPYAVAIYLRVADYFRAYERHVAGSDDGSADLWQHLVRDLARSAVGEPDPPNEGELDEALVAAASEGRVLVGLDGLDERARVTDGGDMVRETIRLHDRLQAANAGGRYSSGQLNRLVLTSRFSGYRTSPVLHPAVENFVLCPLIPRQVTRLHKALFDTL